MVRTPPGRYDTRQVNWARSGIVGILWGTRTPILIGLAGCSSDDAPAPRLEGDSPGCVGLGAGGATSLDDAICPTTERPSAASFEDELAQFRSRDAATPPPEAPIVFTGSSSIALWTNLAADMAPHPVVENGLSGSRISDTLAHYESTILPYDPQGVVLYAGENELDEGLCPPCVFRDFEALVELLRAAGLDAPVLYISMKPSPARSALLDGMAEANAYIEAFAAETENVEFIDIVEPMLDETGAPRPELFTSDRLHMNEAGYAIWAAAVKPYLDDL